MASGPALGPHRRVLRWSAVRSLGLPWGRPGHQHGQGPGQLPKARSSKPRISRVQPTGHTRPAPSLQPEPAGLRGHCLSWTRQSLEPYLTHLHLFGEELTGQGKGFLKDEDFPKKKDLTNPYKNSHKKLQFKSMFQLQEAVLPNKWQDYILSPPPQGKV